jgi:hypothetical protein
MPLTVERGWDYLHVNLQDDTQHDAAQVVDHVRVQRLLHRSTEQ